MMLEKGVLIVIVLIAALLTFLAVPRLFSSRDALYADVIIQQISAGEVPTEVAYQKAYEHLVSAIDWVNSDVYWRQLSYLKFNNFELNIAESHDVDRDIANLYATTEVAISLMPAAPYVWHDMAFIQAMYAETRDSALSAVKMSTYVDRCNKNLLKSRVLFLWNNFEVWDEEARAIFKSQLFLLWQLKRSELLQVLRGKPEIKYFILDALSDSPDELVIFNKLTHRFKSYR